MKRREFLSRSVKAGIAAGTMLPIIDSAAHFYESKPSNYNLAAIKGAEPDMMFNDAIKAMGGMNRFIKKGQSVLVKPNIGWDVSPERAGNTNPLLVKRIIEACYEAGAKEVVVFDHTCDNWKRCYSNSGIESAVKEAKGRIISGDSEGYYQEVSIKGAKNLKTAKVHEALLKADVFINVPVLKNHSSTELTISMKNLMGVVWDRSYWHRNDLNQCIADFIHFRKPDLNVVDAYNVMKRNGPRGVSKADLVTMKSLIISPDIAAADTAASKLFGLDPGKIEHIRIASDAGAGESDLSKLSIYRKIF